MEYTALACQIYGWQCVGKVIINRQSLENGSLDYRNNPR